MEENNTTTSEKQIASNSSESNEKIKPVDKYGFFGGSQYTVPSEPLSKLTLDSIRSRELKWIEMIENWDRYMSKNFHKVKERCRKGIPDSLRSKAWQLLSGSYIYLSSRPRKFQSYLKGDANSLCLLEIKKDVNRQFPHHELFTEEQGQGQEDLFNLLKAYSIHKPEVGYCQAQAPLAALLLTIMPLEQAFWCFTVTCDSYLPGYYDKGLEAVQVDSLVLMGLLKKCNSAAYRHLKKLKIDPLLWMVDWFMCIYARTLPWPTLLRVWDMFYCEGVKVLFIVALAIVRIVLGTKEKIANSGGFYETLDLLKKVPQDQLAEDVFIPQMMRVTVTSGDMEREQKRQLRKWKSERQSKLSTENSKSIWKSKFFKMKAANVEEKGDYVVKTAKEESNEITDEELQKQLDKLQDHHYDNQLVNSHNNSFHIPVKRFSIKKLLSPPPKIPTQPPSFPPLHQQDAATDTTIDSLISFVKNMQDKNKDKEDEEKKDVDKNEKNNDEDAPNTLTKSDNKDSFANKIHGDYLKTDIPKIENNFFTGVKETCNDDNCENDNGISSRELASKCVKENDDEINKHENNLNDEPNQSDDVKVLDEIIDTGKIDDGKETSSNPVNNHEGDRRVVFEGSFGEQANVWVGKYLINNSVNNEEEAEEKEEKKSNRNEEDETISTINRNCKDEGGVEECGDNVNCDKFKPIIEQKIIYCAGDDVMLAGRDEMNVVGDKGDNNFHEDNTNEENMCNEDCYTQNGFTYLTKDALNDVEMNNHYATDKCDEMLDGDPYNFDTSLDVSVFTVVPNTSVCVPPEAENFNNNHDLVGGFNDNYLLASGYKDKEENDVAGEDNEFDGDNVMNEKDSDGRNNENYNEYDENDGGDYNGENENNDDKIYSMLSDNEYEADEPNDEDDYEKNDVNDKEDNDIYDRKDDYDHNNDDDDKYNDDNDEDNRYNNDDKDKDFDDDRS